MKKLADISSFEGLQNRAHTSMGFGLSVFNALEKNEFHSAEDLARELIREIESAQDPESSSDLYGASAIIGRSIVSAYLEKCEIDGESSSAEALKGGFYQEAVKEILAAVDVYLASGRGAEIQESVPQIRDLAKDVLRNSYDSMMIEADYACDQNQYGEWTEEGQRRELERKGMRYEEYTVPTWAIMYLEYEGDPRDYGLSKKEAAEVDAFRELIGNGKYTIGGEEYFSNSPEFGQPTQCVTLLCVVDD